MGGAGGRQVLQGHARSSRQCSVFLAERPARDHRDRRREERHPAAAMGRHLCLETNERGSDGRKRSLKAMREAVQERAGLGARLGESATAKKNTPVASSTMAGPVGRSNWNDSRTPVTETSTPIATE